MNSIKVKNGQAFKIADIQFENKEIFQENIKSALSAGLRIIALFPSEKSNPEKLLAVFADSQNSLIHIIGGLFPSFDFDSLSKEFPQISYFESELSESFGYKIHNHQKLRPVRKQNIINGNEPYEFYKLNGDEVHEIAVGPIHAGVIEPGHFRFQCHGELVYNLEIHLGYQHRGIEQMMMTAASKQRIILAESIAGDSAIAHTYAHCFAIEELSETRIDIRAQMIRSIAEELERIAMHLAGLGGIANDIGFAIVASSYGRLRTLAINSLADICGSRFGRGLFVYGGTRFDLNSSKIDSIKRKLDTIRKDINQINSCLFSSTGAMTRLEGTGKVSRKNAEKYGIVGFIARTCGLDNDTRIQFPYGAYHYYPVSEVTLSSGDVFARARQRSLEIDESLRLIDELINSLTVGIIHNDGNNLRPGSIVVSMVEGWRGEVIHCALTDNNGNLAQYKIKDPSFNNWFGLSLALRETPVIDFPLCNKSFDMSYAGHDL